MQSRSDPWCRFVIPDPIHPIHNSTFCEAHHRPTNALASVTSAKYMARASFTTPLVLDGMDIHPSDPQLASSHSIILSRRPPKPSGGMLILIRTGNRRSASRTACWGALMTQPGDT
jgi:hypothetical protein